MAGKASQKAAWGEGESAPVFGLGRVLGGSWDFLAPLGAQDPILIAFWLFFEGV